MIKTGPLARSLSYYTRDGSPGTYYGREVAGLVAGGAAAAAGLSTTATVAELKNILDGRSADGSRVLLPPHPRRKQGCELHAAPDKSVSALYGVVLAAAALNILGASEDALRGAIRQAEAEAGITRRGRGGKRHEHGKLVFVIYTHRTSRAGDPQIHHHVVVCNLVLRPDGTWGAHHNRQLYRIQKRMTATYNRLLRDNLLELGIDARLKDGRCVVAGVPQALCAEFSTRRREVVEGKKRFHPNDPEAAQKAAWGTRRAKAKTPEDKLRERWQEAARRHGYDPAASFTREPSKGEVEFSSKATGVAHPGQDPAVTRATPPAAGRRHAEPTPKARVSRHATRGGSGVKVPVAAPDRGADGPDQQKPERAGAGAMTGKPQPSTPPSATGTQQPGQARVPPGIDPAPVPGVKPPDPQDKPKREPAPPLWLRTRGGLPIAAVKRAVKESSRTFAHFGWGQLWERATEILAAWDKAGYGAWDGTRLGSVMHELKDRPRRFGLVSLPAPPASTGPLFATRRQWKLEQAVVKRLTRIARSRTAVCLTGDARALLDDAPLLSGQRDAVLGVAASPSGLSLIDGRGGSGKSTAARALSALLAADGKSVYVVAPTARAAESLARDTLARGYVVPALLRSIRKPGVLKVWERVFKATRQGRHKNLQQLLRHAENVHKLVKRAPVTFDPNTVVLIDDAHRVPTADLLPVLAAADRAGAKVVLVGDSLGTAPGRPAGVFSHAASLFPKAALGGPLTAKSPVREALASLEQGHGQRAIDALHAAGLVAEGRQPLERLLEAYAREGYVRRPEDIVVLAVNSKEALRANEALQALRLAGGQLGKVAAWVRDEVLRVNDRVSVIRTDRKAGLRLGETGTVTRAGLLSVAVRFDDGRVVDVPKKDPPLRLAYAADPSAARRMTVQEAYLLIDRKAPNREQASTLLARVRGRVTVFADPAEVRSGRLGRALGRSGWPGMAVAITPQPAEPRQTQSPGPSPGY